MCGCERGRGRDLSFHTQTMKAIPENCNSYFKIQSSTRASRTKIMTKFMGASRDTRAKAWIFSHPAEILTVLCTFSKAGTQPRTILLLWQRHKSWRAHSKYLNVLYVSKQNISTLETAQSQRALCQNSGIRWMTCTPANESVTSVCFTPC